MARAGRTVAAGLVLGLGVSTQASAQTPAVRPLMVLVDDHAGVSARVLQRATEVTSRVFQDINVEIIWVKHEDARLADQATLQSLIIVHLLSRDMTERTDAPPEMLGAAAPGRPLRQGLLRQNLRAVASQQPEHWLDARTRNRSRVGASAAPAEVPFSCGHHARVYEQSNRF